MMSALIRVIEVLLIGLLLALAMQNDAPVQLTIMNDWAWTKPLILWLFLFFVGGVLVGLLATVTLFIKKRSEINRLKAELSKAQKSLTQEPVVPQRVQSPSIEIEKR